MKENRQDILNGWKEIAAYLGRDSRTVERWEKQRSLPVRRVPGKGRASVYALKSELDSWLTQSPLRGADDPELSTADTPALAGRVNGEARSVSSVNGSTADTSAVESAAEQPAVRAVVAAPVPVSLRWRVSGSLLFAICCLALAALGWHHVRRSPQPASDSPENSVAVESGSSRRIVASSAVPGVEELYLRACYQSEQRTPESLHRALVNFQTAIAKDPTYAPAFAGLASTFVLLREYSLLPDSDAYPQAKRAALQAIALDPHLPQAHADLGFVEFFWDWNPPASEAEFRTALRLDPDLPLSHHWLGSVLTHEGRFGEALPELKTAQRLDPSSGAILTLYALARGLSGDRGAAADMLQEAISNGDGFPDRNPATMHNVLGMLSLLTPADLPRFLNESTRAAELRKDDRRVATLRLAESVYKAHGEQAMWRSLLEEEKRRHSAEPTYSMARYEARLGANEEALTHLAALAARHDPEMIGISVDPLLFGLHGEPRFQQVRASMRLPGTGETPGNTHDAGSAITPRT